MQARTVVIGEVLSVYEQSGVQVVSVMVQKKFRGEPAPVIEFTIAAQTATKEVEHQAPEVVQNYKVMVFLDRHGTLVEGNGLYVVQGGYAWRNKNSRTFLDPTIDRAWINTMDPSTDYITLSLTEIEKALDKYGN